MTVDIIVGMICGAFVATIILAGNYYGTVLAGYYLGRAKAMKAVVKIAREKRLFEGRLIVNSPNVTLNNPVVLSCDWENSGVWITNKAYNVLSKEAVVMGAKTAFLVGGDLEGGKQ